MLRFLYMLWFLRWICLRLIWIKDAITKMDMRPWMNWMPCKWEDGLRKMSQVRENWVCITTASKVLPTDWPCTVTSTKMAWPLILYKSYQKWLVTISLHVFSLLRKMTKSIVMLFVLTILKTWMILLWSLMKHLCQLSMVSWWLLVQRKLTRLASSVLSIQNFVYWSILPILLVRAYFTNLSIIIGEKIRDI